MRVTSLALPLLALFSIGEAKGQAPTVTVYSDSRCKNPIQILKFTTEPFYECTNFQSTKAKGVIFSKGGWTGKGYNVWDAQYCAGDQAGGIGTLGKCLTPTEFGLVAWKSAHISPRNVSSQ